VPHSPIIPIENAQAILRKSKHSFSDDQAERLIDVMEKFSSAIIDKIDSKKEAVPHLAERKT
jgi:hypothetical protein